MILNKNMKLTQLRSFPNNYSIANNFEKDHWFIANISMRGKNKFYTITDTNNSILLLDEEAIRDFFTNWTNWKNYLVVYEGKRIVVQYRTNYRIVEVKNNKLKAKATCHKADCFDLHEGIILAFKRTIEKQKANLKKDIYKKNTKDYSNSAQQILSLLVPNLKERGKKPELFEEQIKIRNLTNLFDIREMPSYYSIIHFTTYDKNISKEFDEHFENFCIENNLTEERKWQQLTNIFYNNHEQEDSSYIMTTLGKSIITVFASEYLPITKMNISAQKKVAKLLIDSLIENNIYFIALWEQEIDEDFINILVKEANNKNKPLTIAIAK